MRISLWDHQVSLVLPLPLTTECIGWEVKMRRWGLDSLWEVFRWGGGVLCKAFAMIRGSLYR